MRQGRSRSWAAWVASAAVHALIAALVLRAGERAALHAPAPDTVEFELEVADPAADEEHEAAVKPDPSPSPSPRKAGRGDKKDQADAPPASSSPSASPPSASPP